MRPGLARQILTAYSAPGDLVVDPICGSGTVAVEGAMLGRRCVGVEQDAVVAQFAERTLDQVIPPGQRSLAEVRRGHADRLAEVLGDLAGAVDLVAMSPREGRVRAAAGTGMAEVYAACLAVLTPGGLLVVAPKNRRRDGRLIDGVVLTRQLAERAGFVYLQHVIALRAAINDGRLTPRPTAAELSQTRQTRRHGVPLHLVIHDNLVVFMKPREGNDG